VLGSDSCFPLVLLSLCRCPLFFFLIVDPLSTATADEASFPSAVLSEDLMLDEGFAFTAPRLVLFCFCGLGAVGYGREE
jgi:hypothetical protein